MHQQNDKYRNMERSFWHFEFAIRISNAVEKGRVSENVFEECITIDDGHSVLVLNDMLFKDMGKRQQAAKAIVGDAFGRTASALFEFLDSMPRETQQQVDLRDFVYMIRCAFSHQIGDPMWKVRGHYKRVMTVLGKPYDLAGLNGKNFEYSDAGGSGILHDIRNNL